MARSLESWMPVVSMRTPLYPWGLRQLLAARPTVGALMDLCEENYRNLHRLAPGMSHLHGSYHSRAEGHVDLHLYVIEQTRYTTLIQLTYYFDRRGGRRPDPNALLRAYHDAAQVEVLSLEQRALPVQAPPGPQTLVQKWKANLFLSKWLSYCVAQGHGFGPSSEARSLRDGTPLALA
jgi:uncharacterized protein YqiB (DUF1249 family)